MERKMKMGIDTSFGPIDIAISGLRAQSKNMEVISSNVANAQSTDDGSGQPYRRLEAILKAESDGLGGVNLEEITSDMSAFPKIFKPGHPDADSQGYVTMPNVNVPSEMMNLNIAARTYQANTAVLKRYQEMVETTLELLK
ncbi:MAG: flagellar basal body rod protein FlgC [Planctomycetes bacterium HGW-Planctomycetes-1]|nr:MAG: flagellar basal body rod protein FlgC [Planctomycetes bacterium HGW-Planctomycetes-1]